MLKLFKVDGVFFDNKMAAKKFRNEHPGSVVSLGPDHRRWKQKGFPRTHSHKMNDSRGNGFPKKVRLYHARI